MGHVRSRLLTRLQPTDNAADATKISDPKVRWQTMLGLSKTDDTANHLKLFGVAKMHQIFGISFPSRYSHHFPRRFHFQGIHSPALPLLTASERVLRSAKLSQLPYEFQVCRDDFAGFSDAAGNFISVMDVMITDRDSNGGCESCTYDAT